MRANITNNSTEAVDVMLGIEQNANMSGRPTRELSTEERFDWLRLIRSENVGPITFYHLLRFYGTAAAALDALPELSRRGGRKRPVRIASKAAIEREIAAIEKAGVDLLAAIEPDYPEPLAAVEDAPPIISVIGNTHLMSRRCVSIVGARNASTNGKRLAQRIATELGEAGVMVVSGLARGIDTAAHKGALETGTVAVLAGGVDICYPAENQDLYGTIAGRGVLIAEQPVGTKPQGRHFPRRNRLISGLALGVLVVEAAPRSGSLITARTALEQGREVFAVPGSPLDPRCQGTNNLIRQGAALTENAADILEIIAPQFRAPLEDPRSERFTPMPGAPDTTTVEKARPAILEALSPTPTAIDEVIRATGLPPAIIHAVLLELELADRLERHPGNRVALI